MATVFTGIRLQRIGLENAPGLPARVLHDNHDLALHVRFTKDVEDLVFQILYFFRASCRVALLIAAAATLAGLICLLLPR